MIDLILAIGIMMIIGFFGGQLAHRFKFPMVTGYIVAGILLSPSLLNIIPQAAIDRLDIFVSIALAIIAYSIGGSLRFKSIREMGRSIAWITPLQSLGAWFLSTLVLALTAPFILDIPLATFWNTYFPIAFIIGAIASATAPAVIIALVHEYRAKGPLTTTLLSVVALDDAIAIIAFAIAIGISEPLVTMVGNLSWYAMLAAPLLEILGSIALGTVLSIPLIYIARLAKSRPLLLVLVLGTIMLCVGISNLLGFSVVLANMVIGLAIANWGKRDEFYLVIDDIEDVIFTLFFVFAGLHFNIGTIMSTGLLALLIVVTGFTGKYFGARAGAQLASSPVVVKKYLGLALLPKAGVSIGLALLAQSAFPSFGALIFNAMLASVIVNELVAPPLVRYAIFKAGESTLRSEKVTK
ncbi:cation:proton antiporter [Chloroflexota bacterium]